uniref:Chitin-binding type-2 domain-containing protein n=1 Tax=Strigamia maritima TaxID=126957 RepID=T1J190_STRMM
MEAIRSAIFILVAVLVFSFAEAQDDSDETFNCPDKKENRKAYYAHHLSCDRYWECDNAGNAKLKTCGNGLAFDDSDPRHERENCDYLFTVDCGDRVELGDAKAQRDALIESDEEFDCPKPNGYFPHHISCDKFWQCEKNRATLKFCGNGLVFDDSADTHENCNYPFTTDCGDRLEIEPPISTQFCPRLHGVFPDEDDCGVFYSCWNGEAKKYNCAAGLAFDQVNRVCVWADQVASCKTTDVAEGFQCPDPATVEQSGSFTRHAHPDDCRKFFVCLEGVARMYGCSIGTVFNTDSSACDDPENVPGCEKYYGDVDLKALKKAQAAGGGFVAKKSRPQQQDDDEDDSYQVCFSGQSQCPQANGRFPVPDQCDAYIICRDGIAETQLCPDGLVFNEKKTRVNSYPCDYPVDVECGTRTRIQSAQPSEHCPHQYGLYSHEDVRNCGQFWNCAAGRAYLFDCPEGLAFNSETLRCDWPDESPTCDPEVFLGFRCPPATPELLEANLGNPRYSHPNECSKFYTCIDGIKPRLISCRSGFVFNPTLNACDDPENVPGCSLINGQCEFPDGFFPDSRQCDKYFECVGGSAVEQLCPDGLVFNDYSTRYARCDLPTAVDCTRRSALQPAQPSLNCPRKWGFFKSSNPRACGQFYRCVDGEAHETDCPEGLVYSDLSGNCEWPDEVDGPCTPEGKKKLLRLNLNYSKDLGSQWVRENEICIVHSTIAVNACPELEGIQVYPHATSCDQFFLCVNGSLTLETCPNGLLFDGLGAVAHFCTYNWQVDCGDRKDFAPPVRTEFCPWLYGIFPITSSCNTQFHKCAEGEAYVTDCEPGLAYDDRTHSCNWPDLLDDCDGTAVTGFQCPSKPTGLSARFYPHPRYPHPALAQQTDVCQSKSNTAYHETHCDKYYACVDGITELIDCPNGLVYIGRGNGLTQHCDYPWRGECGDKLNRNAAIQTEHCEWLYGIFSHETSCTRYWTCWNGTAVEQYCIGGLLYNEETHACDWPQNVNGCQKHPLCKDDPDGRVTLGKSCTRFWQCIGGYPRLMRCAATLVFDKHSRRCVEPPTEDCDVLPTTTVQPNDTGANVPLSAVQKGKPQPFKDPNNQ